MALDATQSATHAHEVIDRVRVFLSAMVNDRSPESIHAEIMDLLAEPNHDERLNGILTDPADFCAVWAGLLAGAEPPEAAWAQVVLPAVIACSEVQTAKSNLEMVTSLWLDARALFDKPKAKVASGVKARPVVPVRQAVEEPAEIWMETQGWKRRGFGRRWVFVGGLVALVSVMVAAWAVWDKEPNWQWRPGGPAATRGAQEVKPELPSATPVPRAPSRGQVPSPTWSGPGPVIAPSAPRALSIVDVEAQRVTLAWQQPEIFGTGGIAYYRILRDRVDTGWTEQTTVTIGGLTASTEYSFTIVAYNGAGLASPPSDPLTVTTQAVTMAAPSLITEPASPIPLGDSFTVKGSGWPCVEDAAVRVTIEGKLVALVYTDSEGSFSAPIHVEPAGGTTATVDVIDDDEDLILSRGSVKVSAGAPAQPQCARAVRQNLQVTFG